MKRCRKEQKCLISGRKCERDRKEMSVRGSLIRQRIPHKSEGVAAVCRETGAVPDSLIRFYYLLNPEQGAGWLTGLPGGIAAADGANGIRMQGPHLSVVMAGWQVLMDRQS